MALSKVISKDQFSEISEELKSFYVESGDGYKLDLEGEEDYGALKRAKEHEKAERLAIAKERDELKAKLEQYSTKEAREKGDFSAFEKSVQEKYAAKDAAREAEFKSALDAKDAENASLRTYVTKAEAKALATKVSTVPPLMAKYLRDRLQVESSDGVTKIRVLDREGRPSAMTTDDLVAEYAADKEFSQIMIASKASGGSGMSNATGGGAAYNPSKAGQNAPDLSKIKPKEVVAYLDAKKAMEK